MPTGVYERKPKPPADPLPRFWSYVEKTPTCWLWKGDFYPDGYPRFWYNGKNHRGNRFIFEQLKRPLQRGEQACHECDNPACVRPDHLFGGTQRDNIQDAIRKGRWTPKGGTSKGSKNGNSRLTEEQVQAIRAEYAPCKAGYSEAPRTTSLNALARKYGVSKFAIQYALKGWKHLTSSESPTIP